MKSLKVFKLHKKNIIPLAICLFFLTAYLLLTIIKHYSFLSGYDLSIIDQAIWKYSQFKNPISTSHVFYDAPIYIDHVELILILLAPLYWIFNSVYALIVLQVLFVISSGVAVYKLSQHYKLKAIVSNALLISYLTFFGLQYALWSDVHSLVFAVGFLSWFLYFLTIRRYRLSILFFVLAIISKEDIALLTLLISGVIALSTKNYKILYFSLVSALYLLIVFFIYFPSVLPNGYRFVNSSGLLGNFNPTYLFDSDTKQKTFLYSLGWFGFVPLLTPLYVLPFLGDLAHYFVLGKGVTRTEDIFLHYRSSVGLLLAWPTIITISRIKKFNSWPMALYLLLAAAFFQYYLHLPLSYLSKKWFWNIPPEVTYIQHTIKEIPENASVVTHINIGSHLAHRDEIYTLFPNVQDFKSNSPCGSKTCRWFRVGGNPTYLLIDSGPSWNALHYLGSRDDFFNGISNLEKNGNIKLIKKVGTSSLYKIVKKI